MITSEFLDMDKRSVYVRTLLKEVVEVYHVNTASLATAAKFNTQYIREFYRGVRNMRHKNLTKLENTIIDLYEPLLRNDFPDNKEELKRYVDLLMR